jgi:hypothetical protein
MKVFHGQQLGLPRCEPSRALPALALRAVPVAARVVDRRRRSTGRTAVQMPAHGGRAASRQGRQSLALLGCEAHALPLEKSRAIAAEDLA